MPVYLYIREYTYKYATCFASFKNYVNRLSKENSKIRSKQRIIKRNGQIKIPSNVRIKSVNEPWKLPKRSNDSVQIGK